MEPTTIKKLDITIASKPVTFKFRAQDETAQFINTLNIKKLENATNIYLKKTHDNKGDFHDGLITQLAKSNHTTKELDMFLSEIQTQIKSSPATQTTHDAQFLLFLRNFITATYLTMEKLKCYENCPGSCSNDSCTPKLLASPSSKVDKQCCIIL